jgi:hypothetical protein
MDSYIDKFPSLLLEEMASNRWLPFLGAGFSLNAKKMGSSLHFSVCVKCGKVSDINNKYWRLCLPKIEL